MSLPSVINSDRVGAFAPTLGVDSRGRTPLLLAASEEEWEIVEELLSANPSNLDVVDRQGLTALHYAARDCQWGIVRRLIELGARRFDTEDSDEYTPLHWAAIQDQEEIVWLLLRAGARSLDKPRGLSERTLLVEFALAKDWHLVLKLIHLGARNFSPANTWGTEDPLTLAYEDRRWDVLFALFENGLEVTDANRHILEEARQVHTAFFATIFGLAKMS